MSRFKADMTTGEELFQAGKLDEARLCFEQIVQENPMHDEAMNNLGTILYSQGDIVSAEQYYQKAFALNENNADVLSNIADLYLNLKRWGEAASVLEQYLHDHHQDFTRQNQLALAYMESGKFEQAVPILEKSLEIRSDQADIQNILKTLKSVPPVKPTPPIRKSAPLVSIGLPVYNGERFISQAIESILTQDFDNFELIISDNCSTDQTEEICLNYHSKDKRIRYYRMDENLGAGTNFMHVLGLAEAPFFMWTTHDDLREKSFISTCLPPFYEDPAVALVYTRTRVLDANSNFLRFHQDPLADQESPQERFRNLIWGLGMCNAILGLFRMSILKKVTAWGKSLFADTLALAEIALMGKFVQIEEPLFIRRLTRDYNYHSHDDRYIQLMSQAEPVLFKEGISFPHSRLAYAHLEILQQSALNDSDIDQLMHEVRNCFRTRYAQQMTYEIDRAVALINGGVFYHQWDQTDCIKIRNENFKTLDHFHMTALLKRLQEAMFFFPEREDLINAYKKIRFTCNPGHEADAGAIT